MRKGVGFTIGSVVVNAFDWDRAVRVEMTKDTMVEGDAMSIDKVTRQTAIFSLQESISKGRVQFLIKQHEGPIRVTGRD